MSEEDKPQQGPDGRWLKGNTAWKGAVGVPKYSRRAERERKAMMREVGQRALEVANSVLTEKLGDVLGEVYNAAMAGDVKAMSLWLKHSAPTAAPAPKLVDSELLERMKNEPPETIIQATVAAMASGEIDVLLGKEIISACKASIDSAFSQKFKKLMRKAQAQGLGIEQILPDLIAISEDMEPIELEALPHDDR